MKNKQRNQFTSFLLVLIFLSVPDKAVAISKIDSLKQTLDTELTDKSRAWTLETIARKYLQSDLDSTEIYALKAVEVYRILKDTNSVARSYNAAGLANYYAGNYDKTLHYWKECLKHYEQTGNKRELSRTNTNIGAVYFNQSDNVTALEYYLKAQKYAEEIQDSLRLMTVYANIASIYGVKKKTTQKAIEYDLKALAIGEHIGDMGTIGTVCGNIAELYLGQHKHALAASYFERSLKAHRGTENEAYALIGMAKVHRSNGELQKAMNFYSQAYDKASEFGLKLDEGDALKGIGQLHLKMGQPELALDNLSQAFKIFSDMNHKSEMMRIAMDLSQAHKTVGAYKSAYEYSALALSLKDSVYNVEFDQKVSDQISDYKLQKKEDEITILNNEKELQTLEFQAEVEKKNRTRNAFALGGLALLVFAVGLWSRLRFVRKSRSIIKKEKERSDELLLNILPFEIAEELKEKGSAEARDFEQATILFTDFKDFTSQAEQLSAQELVAEIDYCFKEFDEICSDYKIEKIKTIGDAYMAAGGLPIPNEESVKNTILSAIKMQSFIVKRKNERKALNLPAFEMRVGIHTGPVVAGIVGIKKFQYDVWGDTVNTASRIESNSKIGKVNISQSTYKLIEDDPQFNFESRGKIVAKGKGEMNMYFVNLVAKSPK